MTNLEFIIMFFLNNVTRKMSKTEIVKYIYWFEYLRVKTCGSQFTDANFLRYNFGPYAFEIQETLDLLIKEELIDLEEYSTYQGYTCLLHKPLVDTDCIEYELQETDKLIAFETIRDLQKLKHDELIEKIYSTAPMVKILLKEKELGETLTGEEINMKAIEECYKTSKDRLLSAKKRRAERVNMGSDEEYMKCLVGEYEKNKRTRERAIQYNL